MFCYISINEQWLRGKNFKDLNVADTSFLILQVAIDNDEASDILQNQCAQDISTYLSKHKIESFKVVDIRKIFEDKYKKNLIYAAVSAMMVSGVITKGKSGDYVINKTHPMWMELKAMDNLEEMEEKGDDEQKTLGEN